MFIMGIPLAAVITPLVFLVALLATDLLNLAVPVSDLADVLQRSDTEGAVSVTPALVAGIVTAVLVPGVVVHLAAWVGVRRLFVGAGSGAALALGARDPRPGELEEHQLANVVEEAAIACGIKAPRIQLLDTEVANAAVIGTDVEDATIVVTTGLLGALNRAETQAVVAHAIGAAGNGDLAIGTAIASVQETIGTMATLLSVPTSANSRRVVGRLFRCAVRPRRDRERSAAELAALVAYTEPEDDEGKRSRVLRIVLFPVALAGGAYSLTRSFYSSLVVDPVLRRGWRKRKMLADATAVELTRNPDALARALGKLANRADLLPGATWASHLFVVGPEAVMARGAAVFQDQLGALAGGTAFANPEAMTALAAMAKNANAATFHPPLGERVGALRRLGASVEATAWVPAAPRRSHRVLAVLFAPFRLLGFAFQLAVPLFAMAVALFLGLVYVLPVAALLHQALRSFG
jgi:Zn-dependent protease with chaperone function